jgi:hypothetical protein
MLVVPTKYLVLEVLEVLEVLLFPLENLETTQGIV